MGCSSLSNRFVITKGIDNIITFTIKKDDSFLPLDLYPTDTFTGELRDLASGSTVLGPFTLVQVGDLVQDDNKGPHRPYGKVELTILAADTVLLDAARGPVEDRYYPKAKYTLVLNCDTQEQGQFIARVPYVFVQ